MKKNASDEIKDKFRGYVTSSKSYKRLFEFVRGESTPLFDSMPRLIAIVFSKKGRYFSDRLCDAFRSTIIIAKRKVITEKQVADFFIEHHQHVNYVLETRKRPPTQTGDPLYFLYYASTYLETEIEEGRADNYSDDALFVGPTVMMMLSFAFTFCGEKKLDSLAQHLFFGVEHMFTDSNYMLRGGAFYEDAVMVDNDDLMLKVCSIPKGEEIVMNFQQKIRERSGELKNISENMFHGIVNLFSVSYYDAGGAESLEKTIDEVHRVVFSFSETEH